MKWIKRLAVFLFVGMLALVCGCLLYFHYLCPRYSGNLRMAGLQEEVEIWFDEYGIPHIYAQNETDLYFALGYVHASERLFQMEMIRRAVSGRLSEILGKDLVGTDRFFRTLSISEAARAAAAGWPGDSQALAPYQTAALAYLAGLNHYVATGKTPVEFTLIGIPKEPFSVQNLYEVAGYMAFGFAEGIKMDPLIEKIRTELGAPYLKDLVLHHREGDQVIPVSPQPVRAPAASLSAHVQRIVEGLPVAPFIGSNAWVFAPSRSASGSVIHANDPHIGYGQPAVWYEAHLEAPGTSMYGYFLAGFPFAILGHNRYAAVGITMLENDDLQFYRETLHPEDSLRVKFQDEWETMQVREEVIQVKDGAPVAFPVYTTRHGPLVSEVLAETRIARQGFAPRAENDSSIWSPSPVALFWTYLQQPNRSLEATYLLSKAGSMDEARHAASLIAAPGLNIMYGDRDGNIAWWTTGRLARFGNHVNTKFFLDGASGRDEVLRWLDFSENPQSENPPQGYVYSANNQPGPDSSGFYYPGYYFPESRAKRIVDLLESRETWTAEQVREMMLDDVNISHVPVAQEFVRLIEKSGAAQSETARQALDLLRAWQGDHGIESQGPVVFYKLLYEVLERSFADELGEDDFSVFVSSPLRKRSLPGFAVNDTSLWWDDTRTQDHTESREEIVAAAFSATAEALAAQLGADTDAWRWGKVHTLEHKHLVGRQPPLDAWFNVGPFPAPGGEEVINNIGFTLTGDGLYPATHGPSRRSVIDFADLENSMSILPTGQSGEAMSPYYDDQAKMYVQGQFRRQLMNRKEIEAQAPKPLVFAPE